MNISLSAFLMNFIGFLINMLPFMTLFFIPYNEESFRIHISGKSLHINPSIVFITTSSDYAVEAFSLNAVHYIVKPATCDMLIQVFDRIYDSASRRKGLVQKIYCANASLCV